MTPNEEHRFTDAEMEIAKSTDLPDLLTHLGYQVKRIGNYYTTKEMDSIRIKNRRTWFRYSEKVGGDAISFLQRFCNKSFPEAVEYLLAYRVAASSISLASAQAQKLTHSAAAPSPIGLASLDSDGNPAKARDSPTAALHVPAEEEKEPISFVLPPRHQDSRRVFAYLRKRGIAPQVIRGFLECGLLYEDSDHHNCVFVGRDSSGNAVFANKRGTYDLDGSGFKGDVPGSNKNVAFRLPCDPSKEWVYAFEAPIDLMSCCTLHRSLRSNAVVLCGLHDGALDTYLEENPHLRRIILCLDSDKWGRVAAERLTTKYQEQGYIVEDRLPPCGKDWNEALRLRSPSRERGWFPVK